MEQELISFKDSFENMIKNKEVDLNIIPTIETIQSELISKKEASISRNLSQQMIFHIYHSTNICNNVLGSIAERLRKAKKRRDNPKIAKDTLSIYPPLFSLARDIDKLNLEDKYIETFHLLSLASDLQISAIGSHLFSEREEIEEDKLNRAKEIVCNLKIGENE